MFSTQTWLGLVLVGVAVLYQRYCPEGGGRDAAVGPVARSWEEIIQKPAQAVRRIAVGVNSNLDMIVSATELLQALNITPGASADHTSLDSLQDLQEIVSYSMQHCAGTERFFSNLEVFQQTVQAATTIPHTYHIGGNAALMAQKILEVEPQAQVLLVGHIGSSLRKLLHPRMATPTFSSQSRDEVHMILEYPRGEEWGAVRATCANRVIYSHDITNSKMMALEAFQPSLESFGPDLVILSGAHLLDGQTETFWRRRLGDITQLLASLPPGLPAHWELATIGDLTFFHSLARSIFSETDSLGLNEQELVSVARAANADGFDFGTIPAKPGVAHVSDLLHWLMQTYGARSTPESRLTRVHFHSLTFHIIATVRGGPWGNGRAAVAAGTRVAGLQACDVTRFHPAEFELRIPPSFTLSHSDPTLSTTRVRLSPSAPTVAWSRGGVDYHLSPVLVCRRPVKTVGLGDAISSFALLHSEFRTTG